MKMFNNRELPMCSRQSVDPAFSLSLWAEGWGEEPSLFVTQLTQVSINVIEVAVPLDEARNAHFDRGVGLESHPGVEFGGIGTKVVCVTPHQARPDVVFAPGFRPSRWGG